MCLSSDDTEFLGFFVEQFTNTTLVTVKVEEMIPGQTYLRELSGEEERSETNVWFLLEICYSKIPQGHLWH